MKPTKPTITQTEIICYAIEAVWSRMEEDERRAAMAKFASMQDLAEQVLAASRWKEKLSLLFALYEIQTGSEHDLKGSVNI